MASPGAWKESGGRLRRGRARVWQEILAVALPSFFPCPPPNPPPRGGRAFLAPSPLVGEGWGGGPGDGRRSARNNRRTRRAPRMGLNVASATTLCQARKVDTGHRY